MAGEDLYINFVIFIQRELTQYVMMDFCILYTVPE